MPLVFAENEATESGISYEDRTGISYQYPSRYRRLIQPGERFVYYRGRRTKSGRRLPQIYFGTGVVGKVTRDPKASNRFNCEVLDYCQFPTPVSFKNERDEYLETGAHRRGYFQPGVRAISEEDFGYIIQVGQIGSDAEAGAAASSIESKEQPTPGYASQTTLRAVEDFAVRVALDEIHQRLPLATIEPQHRNNPGFDILVRPTPSGKPIYVEVKGTTRGRPQFFMTEGELQFSRRYEDRYQLIVIYGIRLEPKTYYILWHGGSISPEGGFRLSPVQWSVEVQSKTTNRSSEVT